MQKLVQAAQSRNLDRIAVAYTVAGWLAVQGAAIVLPAFDAPAWTLRVLIVAIILGFPLVLAAGWFLSAPVAPAELPPARISHREVVLVALLGIVLLLSIGELVLLPRRSAPLQTGAAVGTDASIAVLPFVNMSGDATKEYFSDGISEELLNDLANVPSLRVAARTSSFVFKTRREDIKTIARLLGVRTVLEGSVREAGDRIRITAQLIDARDGFHLWSSTYDRTVTDILAVQADIAAAITGTLTRRLVPSRPADRPKIDPRDYRDYLAGIHFNRQRSKDGVTRAVALLEHVTDREPRFADAFAALASAYLNVDWLVTDQSAYREKARGAMETALRIEPANATALYLLARLDSEESNWPAVENDLQRLAAASPNSAQLATARSTHFFNLALFREAAAEARKAAELDALSSPAQDWLAYLLLRAGETDAAIAAWKTSLELQPWADIALYGLCDTYAFSRRIADARNIDADLRRTAPVDEQRECEAEIDIALHDYGGARKLVDLMAAEGSRGQLGPAEKTAAYIQIGDFNAAMQWAEKAFEAGEIVDLGSLQYDRTVLPTPFFDTPAWKTLTMRPKLRIWAEERARVAAELHRD